MPSSLTEVTEIVTALGMLPHYNSPVEAITARPATLVNVRPKEWMRLEIAAEDARRASTVAHSWDNGRAFLHASDGLRGRDPLRIEWKGPHRPPGYDLLPADLRVDHVFLVSCKYLSHVLMNPSPAHLFDRGLEVRAPGVSRDWYAEVAPEEYDAFYSEVRSFVGEGLPLRREDLNSPQRELIGEVCARRWPAELEEPASVFSNAVAKASAARWSAAMPTAPQRELMFWRLLRLNSAPYFVLGTSERDVLRLRIATPWDWRQRYRLDDFQVFAQPGGQPRVGWCSEISDLGSKEAIRVGGHAEVRWSHGRFCGMPEAKVYLDTPHTEVPGYEPLH